MSHSKSVNHILNASNSGLTTIVQRAALLNRLNMALKKLLDEPLSEQVYVANVRGDVLVIGTHSAVWHNRVKYLGPTILQQFKSLKGWEFLRHIEFRVQPQVAQASLTQSHNDTKVTNSKFSNIKKALKDPPG